MDRERFDWLWRQCRLADKAGDWRARGAFSAALAYDLNRDLQYRSAGCVDPDGIIRRTHERYFPFPPADYTAQKPLDDTPTPMPVKPER